jgi:transposase InsO family protein
MTKGEFKQIVGIVYSSWCLRNFGFIKVYLDKKADSTIDFVKSKVLPVYSIFGIPLDSILTDNGKEYTTHWKNAKHDYEIFLAKCGITHTRIKPRCPKSDGIIERFNRTLLEEFYQIAMLKNIYTTLDELQHDLDSFIHYYNFKRTNQEIGRAHVW